MATEVEGSALEVIKELGWHLPSTRLLKQGNWGHVRSVWNSLDQPEDIGAENELKEGDQLNESMNYGVVGPYALGMECCEKLEISATTVDSGPEKFWPGYFELH